MVWPSRNTILSLTTVGVRHDEKRNIVALNLEMLRMGGGKQCLEEHKGLSPIFGKNVKIDQRRTVSPGACDCHRSEADSLVVGLQAICERPARSAMNRIVDDLTIHLFPVTLSQREHVSIGRETAR